MRLTVDLIMGLLVRKFPLFSFVLLHVAVFLVFIRVVFSKNVSNVPCKSCVKVSVFSRRILPLLASYFCEQLLAQTCLVYLQAVEIFRSP